MKKFLIVAGLLSSFAMAVVSIKPVEIQSEPSVSFEQGLSFSSKSGNVDKMNFKLASSIKQYGSGYVNTLFFFYDYGESRGEKDTNALFLHLRHIHDLGWGDTNGEAFVQIDKDDFRDIASRSLMGGNLRYKIDTKKLDVFIGLGLLYTWLDEAGIKEEYSSINSYISLNYQFSPSTSITYKGYYQPRLDDMDDYLVFQKAQLKVNITNRLSLFVNLLHEYDSKPPAGIEKSDFAQTTGFSYKF